jgi:hypothetical protein
MGSCNAPHAFQDCGITELQKLGNGIMLPFDNSPFENYAVIPGISAYSSSSGG